VKTRARIAAALMAALAVLATLLSPATPADAGTRTSRAAATTSTSTSAKTLVLYDSTGPWGYLGELYGIGAANLAGHFGSVTSKPVTSYTRGELSGYAGVIYMGSTYDEPVPSAFLDDVLATSKPVVWSASNIWQLTGRAGDFASRYGWMWTGYDFSTVGEVVYKGTSLTRYSANGSGILGSAVSDATKATVLAEAVRADGTRFPWAVRSRNLTYIGELPFSYMSENDRYLAFADLLFDALAPSTPVRHRAMVRLEDVGPDADPTELRRIADYLANQRVPFSFGVYSVYKDPYGVNNDGRPQTLRLADQKGVVDAIKYMQSKGGTMIMHGWTHQFEKLINPYNGVSGDDFEFYTAHVDAEDYVRLDGPVPGDSTSWALGRVSGAKKEFERAKLSVPTIFEFPHYAGSAVDYKAIRSVFSTRYERSLYFGGLLKGGTVDHSRVFGQFFPYAVTDVYGSKVLPENLGNIELEEMNHHPPRFPADIVASARRNLVVRDGFASFFFHPSYPIQYLKDTVQGIKALGYQFVSPTQV
jgi:uncharacterized protein YdaL